MPTLIYLHGFLSSPQSYKSRVVERWLSENRPDIEFICPALSSYPAEAIHTLTTLLDQRASDRPMLLGSSLGGYWAKWLAHQYDLRAVLVNPLVEPERLMANYVGKTLKNYHTDETYQLTERDRLALLSVNVTRIEDVERYWLMVQTGDESLDYRRAVDVYRGCRQLIEEGGDHGFTQFERWVPSIIAFLEAPQTARF